MMISNVRCEFRSVRGGLELNDADITQSEIDIEIDTSSIYTCGEHHDTYPQNSDCLDIRSAIPLSSPLRFWESTRMRH